MERINEENGAMKNERNEGNGNQFTYRPFFRSFYIFNQGIAESYGRGFSELPEELRGKK